MENAERKATNMGPGEGKSLWVLGDLYRFLVTGEDTNGAFALIENTASPGLPGPPPHIHHQEDEAFYLLEGRLEVLLDDRVFRVDRAGSFVHIPRGTVHTFKNVGTTQAKFLAMISPAGFERFFEQIGEPATDGDAPPLGPPNVEKVLELAPRYGCEILPPSGE